MALSKTLKSKQLIAEVKTVNYWLDGARRALYNSKFLAQDANGQTDEERAIHRQARNKGTNLLYQVNKLINDEFAPAIGKQIINEQT